MLQSLGFWHNLTSPPASETYRKIQIPTFGALRKLDFVWFSQQTSCTTNLCELLGKQTACVVCNTLNGSRTNRLHIAMYFMSCYIHNSTLMKNKIITFKFLSKIVVNAVILLLLWYVQNMVSPYSPKSPYLLMSLIYPLRSVEMLIIHVSVIFSFIFYFQNTSGIQR